MSVSKVEKEEALRQRLEHHPCHRADFADTDETLQAHGAHEHWMESGSGERLYWCEGLKAHPKTMIGRAG